MMLDDEALRLLVEHGTFYCPTLSVYIPKTPEEDTDLRRRIVASHRQVFQKAMRMGVKIVFGTDVGAFAHGTNAREFELMVEYGMKPIEAIRFHTSRRTTPPESYASGSRSATIARYETDKHTRPDRHPRHAVSFRARLGHLRGRRGRRRRRHVRWRRRLVQPAGLLRAVESSRGERPAADGGSCPLLVSPDE
ncbi:MAG: hypothetical protein DMF67_04420 [Acidobacteria bacterium]|nr:MAG: hypothetical protein DMF67_04420 [Acidobacteriota bacterium]